MKLEYRDRKYTKVFYIILSGLMCGFVSTARADIASKQYVDTIVGAVTKATIGLGNVPNVDATNASNISSGTLAYGRLPVGVAANTVAAGNDSRFDTLSTTAPSGTASTGRVWVWLE